jgi:RNA polymerase-binding transcription factor DksA
MLVSQGCLNGSKEFRNAYQRELRLKNPELEKVKWKRYYEKKQKETDGNWNKTRLKEWRESNPGKWKDLMKRASENGLHRRFYANHREELKRKKSAIGKAARRKDPCFGLRKEIGEFARTGNVSQLVQELGKRIDGLDRKS